MAISRPFNIEVEPRSQSVIAVVYLAVAITAFAVGYVTHYPATGASSQTLRSTNAGMTAPWGPA
jgi:hypothetical protein